MRARKTAGVRFGGFLLALLCIPLFASAQSYTIDAVSREVSIFDDGPPGPAFEAISREVSIFDNGAPSPAFEAISREVSIFDTAAYALDGVSREVSVFNYGYNSFNVSVGSTILLAGTTTNVSVTLSTLAPVTNVEVAVDFPPSLLTDWNVQVAPPMSGTLQISNNSRLYVTFNPPGGQGVSNTIQLGQLQFTAVDNQPSAFLPLTVADATAPMLDGEAYTPNKTFQDGEVIVLHTNSLLRLTRTNGLASLTLYGFSGTNYTIQSTTNLLPPVQWMDAFTLVPSNFIAIFPDLQMTNRATFYRAEQ